MSCTDAGADEVAARQAVEALFRLDRHCWMFESNCLQHQFHLMVTRSLAVANSFLLSKAKIRYVSAITKLMHLWRERAVDIFMLWTEMFGASDPVQL